MRLAVTTLWFVLAILCSEQAFAHAALVESSPVDGAVLNHAPSTVRLRFNEPVSPLVIGLTDAQGRTHRELAAAARDEMLEITLPSDLPRGSQILSYRVISGDSHPVSGSLVFSIGPPTGAAGVTPEDNRVLRSTLWLARLALYLGLFVGCGGAFFLAWLAPSLPLNKPRRLLGSFIALGALAAVLSLGLQGLDALGQKLGGLEASAAWVAGWQTSFGLTVAVALAALFLAWGALYAPAMRWRQGCSLAALIGAGLSLTLSGHASAAAPHWLARTAVFLHVIGVTYWIGALIPLIFVIRQDPAQALSTVRRFSNGALIAVAILTAAGLILAVMQVEVPANVLETDYGRVLIAKTVLVAGLLGLAAANRLWLTPALSTPSGFGGKWLVRSIAAEIVLVATILALVGLWRFTLPPRVLARAAEAAAPVSVLLHTPNLMAQVTLSPGRVGLVRVDIVLASGRPQPVNAEGVTLALSKPEAGVEPLERHARKTGRDRWQIDGLNLPLAGPWQIRLEILVNDFEKTSLEGSIAIRP